MRFNPHHCPECGQPAIGTADIVPAVALFDFDENMRAEYTGTSKLYWEGQTTETDQADNFTLVCEDGHHWPAAMTDDDETQPAAA